MAPGPVWFWIGQDVPQHSLSYPGMTRARLRGENHLAPASQRRLAGAPVEGPVG